jgi:hypothetical protein
LLRRSGLDAHGDTTPDTPVTFVFEEFAVEFVFDDVFVTELLSPAAPAAVVHCIVTMLEQSATHCAVTFAVHAVRASTDARSSQATFASTPQVAEHCELHWLSQLDFVVDLHLDAQASSHCEVQ